MYCRCACCSMCAVLMICFLFFIMVAICFAMLIVLRLVFQVLQLRKADELVGLLIPQSVADRLQAAKQAHWLHLREHGIRTMAAFKIVVWDSRAEVVTMMKADVA